MKHAWSMRGVCVSISFPSFIMTTLTECGLKESLSRMMDIHQRRYAGPFPTCLGVPSLTLFRQDERIIELSLNSSIISRRYMSNSDGTPSFDLVMKWKGRRCEDCESLACDEGFLVAMSRHFGDDIDSLVIDSVTKDMKSVIRVDIDAGANIARLKGILEATMALELCQCERNMVHDGCMVCFTCMAGLPEKDLCKHMCGVCHETAAAPIEKTECCQQWIHSQCLRKCGPRCPFCRAFAASAVTSAS